VLLPLQATFTLQSDERPDIGFRTYTSLDAATQEAAKSRLFAGLHFPSANDDGQLLGKLVAEYVYDNFLKSSAAKGTATPKPVLALQPYSVSTQRGATQERPVQAAAGSSSSSSNKNKRLRLSRHMH
jgi:hypothetical protein